MSKFKIYKVGGCVRNTLLGRNNKDTDYEVHGITQQDFFKKFPQVQQDSVGKQFGVYLGDLFGTGEICEISFPRKEQQQGCKHKDIVVEIDPFLGIEKAALRRDLTINALYQDAYTGEIFDPTGRGLHDIQNRVIDLVDERTFLDDPLRPIRALRFARTLQGFKLSPRMECIVENIDYTILPGERIAGEYLKMPMKYWHEIPDINVLPKQSREMYKHFLLNNKEETIWEACRFQKAHLLKLYSRVGMFEMYRNILNGFPVEVKKNQNRHKELFVAEIKKHGLL